ncbi:MAG: hypothetical protein WC943_02120 [Elusimicrobiota bacterium]|jgi:hypothetical protein
MDSIVQSLHTLETSLTMLGSRASTFQGKLEDLLFRAQKMAQKAKNNLPETDTMYSYDVQHLRHQLRDLSNQVETLPTAVGELERIAVPDAATNGPAQSVSRLATTLGRSLALLHEHALLAAQHIRSAEHKVEAWYLVQETEQMSEKAKATAGVTQRLALKTAPAPAPASPAPAPVQPPTRPSNPTPGSAV